MSPQRLRILTYTVPDAATDTFYLLRDIVEEATGLEADLIVENRFSGPSPGRACPFSDDLADLVFMNSTDYLKLKAEQKPHMELCPVAPVYDHPLVEGRPVYFSEIIIHAANVGKYKDLAALKGCTWAYPSESSLSGNRVVLNHLRNKFSTNASFFGTIVQTGSHLKSIQLVLDQAIVAASVASTALNDYLRTHVDHRDKLVSLISLGPLPINPLLFNDRLPGDVKQKITECLKTLSSSDKFSARMKEVGITGFTPVMDDLYKMEETIVQRTDGMSMNTAYY